MRLKDNDKIRVPISYKAGAILYSASRSITKLDPGTELTVEDMGAKRLFVSSGRALFLVESLPSGSFFEIRTPTTIVKLAGSGISVEIEGRNTIVSCFMGKAYVSGIDADGISLGQTIQIDKDFKSIVGTNEMPSNPIALTMTEEEEWSQFRENLCGHFEQLVKKGLCDKTLNIEQIDSITEQFDREEEEEEIRDDYYEETLDESS